MNPPISVRRAFGLTVASVLGAFIVGSLVVPLGSAWFANSSQRVLSFISIFVGQACIIVPTLVYLLRKNESLRDRLRFHPISLPLTFSTIVFAIGVIVLMDEVDRLTSILLPLPDYLENMGEFLDIYSPGSAILLIASLVFLAPLGEELLFRGFLQQILERAWKDPTRAVLITSLFFALIHLNPYWVIQIYLLGMILGYLSWRSGSVLPGVILHITNNGIALFLNNVSGDFERFYLWHGHVSPIWIGLAILFAVWGFRQFHSLLSEEEAV